jgi:hypothetical protein
MGASCLGMGEGLQIGYHIMFNVWECECSSDGRAGTHRATCASELDIVRAQAIRER